MPTPNLAHIMNSSKSYNHLLLLLPLLLLSQIYTLCHSISADPACHTDDTNVLISIKHYFGNPRSLASWDPKNECCGTWEAWDGIKCDGKGHITSLEIFGANDIYAIPPFLDRLPFLSELSFSVMPNLTGPIPPYIGNLTNLTSFIIYLTNVSGPIPSVLGSLTNLNDLELASNKFTGSIPDFLGQLTRLAQLDLSNNTLTGPIPVALANLTKLDTLSLNSNNLSGPIPDFLGQRLVNLTTLDLHSNKLSGPIPTSLSLFRNLSFLSLSDNQLTGSVPKTLALANIPDIRLAQNQLTGDASFLFDKNTTNVGSIDVSNNSFKFDLSDIDLAPNLMSFNISHNMIYGSLPQLFYRLKEFDVSYNDLCGPIPNGRRLKQVDPTVFAHNKCLCGGPLPECK